MNFSLKVAHAFFYHDSEKDIINGLYCLIAKFQSLEPGQSMYLETRVKQFCAEYDVETYENLVQKVLENINVDSWKWNDIARLFWTLHLINDAARFELGLEERENFRKNMIEKVGEKLSFIDKYQWITMPLINVNQEPPLTNDFSWSTFVAGGLIVLFIRRYLI